MLYKDFRLDEIFKIKATKSLDAGQLEFIDNGINFVGRTFENNGIQGKIVKQQFEPNEPYTITATVIGNYKYTKVQMDEYYCSQNINKLVPIDKNLSINTLLYLVTHVQKFISKWDGQQGGYKLEDINSHIVSLPTSDGINPDYEKMDSLISELEQERISELDKYLKVTELNDYELSDEDKNVLNKNVLFINFKINELFKQQKIKKRYSKLDINENGNILLISSDTKNNGILGFVDKQSEFITDNNCPYYLIFGDHTRSMNIISQSFVVTDNVKVLKPNYFNIKATLYIISVWKKQIPNIGYARHWKLAHNVDIPLPSKDGINPDYEYMEKYITAIEKLTIKNVVEYKDKIIEKTKQVCGE